MELERIKELISAKTRSRRKFIKRARTARRYYRCENDIKRKKKRGGDPRRPFQTANHKIASNFYRLLVIQKVSYLFGNEVLFDVGHEETNAAIKEILGTQFANKCRELATNASNDTKAWMQYWIDDDNEFHYAVLDSLTVYDGWGGRGNNKLLYVLVVNNNWIDENGDQWDTYEYWDSQCCYAFKKRSDAEIDELEYDYQFLNYDTDSDSAEESYILYHDYGEVPFICFKNNRDELNDLAGLKDAIDSYDESRSGLADDIADCEEVIFVLSGYGDQDPKEFWDKVSENRLIKLVNDPLIDEGQKSSNVELLAIEPPIKATQLNLELERKAIFEQGMGVDPTPDSYGNTSGEALKHMYNLLMLKSTAMKNEFEVGFFRLVRAICKYLNFELSDDDLIQTWTPTMIANETETINNIKNSVGLLSNETLIRKHPFVENPEYEIELIAAEQEHAAIESTRSMIDSYLGAIQGNTEPDDEDQI